MTIESKLSALGLAEYVDAFKANEITPDQLAKLSNDDLKDIGISQLGVRKRMLAAFAGTPAADIAAATPETPKSPGPVQPGIDEPAEEAAEQAGTKSLLVGILGLGMAALTLAPWYKLVSTASGSIRGTGIKSHSTSFSSAFEVAGINTWFGDVALGFGILIWVLAVHSKKTGQAAFTALLALAWQIYVFAVVLPDLVKDMKGGSSHTNSYGKYSATASSSFDMQAVHLEAFSAYNVLAASTFLIGLFITIMAIRTQDPKAFARIKRLFKWIAIIFGFQILFAVAYKGMEAFEERERKAEQAVKKTKKAKKAKKAKRAKKKTAKAATRSSTRKPVSASASSSLKSTKSNTYGARNILDDNPATAWTEGERDGGIGVSLRFDSVERPCTQLRIMNGYQKNGKIFRLNARVRAFTASINGVDVGRYTLEDRMGWQDVDLQIPANSSVALTIDDVYRGDKWQDTSISEVRLNCP